jgi:mannonate dehydratase
MAETTTSPRYALRAVPGYAASRPGIQLGTSLGSKCSDEDLQFVQQLGLEWVCLHIEDERDHNVEYYLRCKERLAKWGLQIFRIGHSRLHNMSEVTLNLPGRDRMIAEFLDYIRNIGKAGVYYNTYGFPGNGIWSSGRTTGRGGVITRYMDPQTATGHWNGKVFEGPLTHGRVYTEDEIWDNYTYFIKQVAPVCEEAGVYLGIHPDDPPWDSPGGVPRCVFGNMAGFKRALEIANSPNIGVCLCVGCWLEGGPGMGADVVEAIRIFGGMGKLFKVHFRNITNPLPQPWSETFIDDGYMDMHLVMRALHEVGFDGMAIPDHIPAMLGGHRVGEAYSIAYMRALIQAIESAPAA